MPPPRFRVFALTLFPPICRRKVARARAHTYPLLGKRVLRVGKGRAVTPRGCPRPEGPQPALSGGYRCETSTSNKPATQSNFYRLSGPAPAYFATSKTQKGGRNGTDRSTASSVGRET